jgi:hypothetical protein
MSRNFQLTLIVITATLLGWLVVQEMQRSRAIAARANEIVQMPVTLASSVTPAATPSDLSSTQAAAIEESNASAPATTEPIATQAPTSCSSFDDAGLLAAFDGALAAFIADASSLYGDRYENLQYELSSKSGTIEGEQGTVTTNYSGTVQELSTGQAVTANGVIRATFSWDGCAWQVVDYSF